METQVPADGVTIPVEEVPPTPETSSVAADPFSTTETTSEPSLADDPNTSAAPSARKKKPAAKRAHRADAPPHSKKKEVRKMAPKKEKGNGAEKVGMAVTADAARQVRRLRASLELKTGDRVSNSDAITTAVKAFLKEA